LAVDVAGSAVAVLQDTPTTTQGNSITLQAEDGVLHNLNTESIYLGYYGTGYVAGWNQDGQWVDIIANIPTAGTYNLTLRFATGAGVASRNITVNGCTVVNNLSFPNTGSWSSYATVTTNNISLNAGNNTISVMYNSSLGNTNYLNLDQITVTQV
jgi:carbohydrate binding protein with CBM35 domain